MRIPFFVVFSVALSGFAPSVKAADRYTYFSDQEHRGKSGDLSFGLAPAIVVCEQKSLRPVAWFGAFKPNDGKSQFLYLLIFKVSPDMGDFEMASQGRGSSSTGAEAKTVARLGKKQIEVAYKLITDAKTHTVRTQSLKLGDQEVKEGDTRVFVVDLTGENVKYLPVKGELPKDAPDVSKEKSEGWGHVVQKAIEQLKKESPELERLLEAKKDNAPAAIDQAKVEITLSSEHSPEKLKAGDRVHIKRVNGMTVTKTGLKNYTTATVVKNAEVVSVIPIEKPKSPDEALKVVLKVPEAQAARLEKMKSALATVFESKPGGGKGEMKKKPVILRLELSNPNKN